MFIRSYYDTERGKSYKEYLMNRDGFSLLLTAVGGVRRFTVPLQWAVIASFGRLYPSAAEGYKYYPTPRRAHRGPRGGIEVGSKSGGTPASYRQVR